MLAFARFVMRDNGLAIHINPEHVTQLRQTIEGEPAVYIAGRETPMVIEGTLEAALRKLEAASAGLKLTEAESATPFHEPEPATSNWASPRMPAVATAVVAASPAVETPPPPPKPLKMKTAPTKTPRKSASAKTTKKASLPKAATAPATHSTASWFKGAS